jgi:chromosome partitioning protein
MVETLDEHDSSVGCAELDDLANLASSIMQRARKAALHPSEQKVLRKFNLSEMASLFSNEPVPLEKSELLKQADALSKSIKRNPALPQGEVSGRNRLFTLEEVHRIQRDLKKAMPWRDPATDPAQIIAVCNYKGGVAKTTTTIHLAQYLALRGYRCLAVDLDPQASLTQLFGVLPFLDIEQSETILPYMEGPDLGGDAYSPTLDRYIRKSHWHNIDLIPSNTAVTGADFSLAGRIVQTPGFPFYRVLREGLLTIADNYDFVLLDTAPALSFLNSNAVFAADSILVTLPPATLELGSSAAFFQLTSALTQTINSLEGVEKRWAPFGILPTKHKPADVASRQILKWMSDAFKKYLILPPIVESSVLQRLGPQYLTVYESGLKDYDGDPTAYRRARDAFNDSFREFELALLRRWPSKRTSLPMAVSTAA